MSRRPGRELELLPHYVYSHFNAECAVIYVGRTSDPDTRPMDSRRRSWISTESTEVLISPEMTFAAAVWVETEMIRALAPKHNERPGQHLENTDWRIDRVCEVEGVTRATARWAVQYYPTDPVEFEAQLATHAEGVRQFEAEVAATGIDPERLAMQRLSEALSLDGLLATGMKAERKSA